MIRIKDDVRLSLRAASSTALHAELLGRDALAAALEVAVPADWPPGEHDDDAVRFFLEYPQVLDAEWSAHYVIAAPTPTAAAQVPTTLVASAGFFGPPNAAGRVEIGYSVVDEWRRRGVASAAVAMLVEKAQRRGADSVIAHARPDNQPSIAVLRRNHFHPVVSTRDGLLGFERRLFTVRLAQPSERAEVNKIYASLDFQPTTASDLQLIAEARGELGRVGAIDGLGRLVPLEAGERGAPGAPSHELGGIWVTPALRGQGTARAIVSALLDTARSRTVACLPFAQLEPFYASFGFVRQDPALAPPSLQHKLASCATTHPDPVLLMIRPAG